MRVLVIGSHGNVGKHLVKYLTENKHQVIAMIRNENQKTEMQGLGAIPFVADLENDFSSAYENIDAVIFTAGSGSKTGPDKTILVDQEAAIRSIDLAEKYNVSRYIMISAQGAKNPEAPSPIQHYFKAKAIADKHLQQSNLDYTILRPGRLTFEPDGKLIVSENIDHKGTTSRVALARLTAEFINKQGAFGKTLEVLDS